MSNLTSVLAQAKALSEQEQQELLTQLEEYLVMLCDLDHKIKRGKISNKLALEMFIMKICM